MNVIFQFYKYCICRVKHQVFKALCVFLLSGCAISQVSGQLTARDADGKVATSYINTYGKRDTIFVFNQRETGSLSLQLSGTNTFKWYQFKENTRKFEPFDANQVDVDVETTTRDHLLQGGYKVTVTPQGAAAPRDSFVAWLYMYTGFDFILHKRDDGEVLYNYKNCFYTDFPISSKSIQPSFTYYDPLRSDRPLTYYMITYEMNGVVVFPNMQGSTLYFRDNSPPYEDTKYYFRAFDLFGVEKRDEILYKTIIPFITINQPVLPETDPASAPVPVRFTSKLYNDITTAFIWRFGDGDSITYDLEQLPPDTVRHTYYTPKTQGYEVTVKVTSQIGCTYISDPVRISVNQPLLEVGNVFTPNNDRVNDYFKPNTVSLRKFEIWIYARSGRRVYYYRGDDLRSWEGWDGRENNGKEAAEGVYYYIIKAYGWDEPATKNPLSGPYHGSFHLYR